MNKTKRKVCAFTGHRPKKFPWRYNEADERCIALKETVTQQVQLLFEAGMLDYLTGMAEGADLWFAQAVLELREKNPSIKLHCFVPYKRQAENWSSSSQERYYAILEQADSIIYVSREYQKDCMLERNRRMIQFADILLAVYNGEYRGGTAATVRYAQKSNIDCFIINPKTNEVTHQEGQPKCDTSEKP